MLIPVQNLKAICDPFEQSPWQDRITRSMVEHCLYTKELLKVPFDELKDYGGLYNHAARIAYMIVNEEALDDPISIDVGVPSLGCTVDWIIVDGNHRFAATLFLGLELIKAEVSGEVSYAEDLLRVPVKWEGA